MSLHNEIMNIPAVKFEATPKHYGEYDLVYKLGHRDARHAAAEMSLKYEKLIDIMSDYVDDESFAEWKRECGL